VAGGDIAALIAAGAFAMLVLVIAVPILRLRHTIDAATRALRDVADQTGPMLGGVNTTIGNVNEALGQVHVTLDSVNSQLARLDHIAENVEHVSTTVANLSTVVTAAAANPLVKVAAVGFGLKRAATRRRHQEEEAEVRTELNNRRKAARHSAD